MRFCYILCILVQAFPEILNLNLFFLPFFPFFVSSLSLIYIYVLHSEKFFCLQIEAARLLTAITDKLQGIKAIRAAEMYN